MKRLISPFSPYVETVMEENPGLHFIASNEDQALAIDLHTNKLHYFYEVNEDIAFQFNMLCEVGQIYKTWFEFMLKHLDYNTSTLYPKSANPYDIITNYK